MAVVETAWEVDIMAGRNSPGGYCHNILGSNMPQLPRKFLCVFVMKLCLSQKFNF